MCESLKVQELLILDEPWTIHDFIQISMASISWQGQTSLGDFLELQLSLLFWSVMIASNLKIEKIIKQKEHFRACKNI